MNPAQRYSVPEGIAAEITRLTKAIKPGDPPVINMGEVYGLGSFSPADQLAVLDAAAAVGFKVQCEYLFAVSHVFLPSLCISLCLSLRFCSGNHRLWVRSMWCARRRHDQPWVLDQPRRAV